MHWLAIGLALLVALAIIAIGAQYVASPTTATRSFGPPLPEGGTNIAWWPRLKGVRDIVSGLIILAFMAWGGPRAVGITWRSGRSFLVLILAAKGSTKSAFGMHGFTAVLMIVAAIPLIMEAP